MEDPKQLISRFVEELWNERRLDVVLISNPASEGMFRITGFKSAGSTVVPSHLSPADLAITKKSYPSAVVVGLRLWESRMRFPSLGFSRAAIAGHRCQTGTASAANSGGR